MCGKVGRGERAKCFCSEPGPFLCCSAHSIRTNGSLNVTTVQGGHSAEKPWVGIIASFRLRPLIPEVIEVNIIVAFSIIPAVTPATRFEKHRQFNVIIRATYDSLSIITNTSILNVSCRSISLYLKFRMTIFLETSECGLALQISRSAKCSSMKVDNGPNSDAIHCGQYLMGRVNSSRAFLTTTAAYGDVTVDRD